MKIKIHNRTGAAAYLFLAVLLTLLIISTAYLLNSMHRAMNVSPISILKADYQLESAIVMQMQKIKSAKTQPPPRVNFSRELSPGYLLMLSSEKVDETLWSFKAKIEGPGFSRKIDAKACLKNPDRIIFSPPAAINQ